MKVLLINPKLKTWSPNVYAPLGLAYVAAALEDASHSVSILDMNSRKVSDKKLQERVHKADIVGITGLITEYKEVIRLVDIIKEYSGVVIILGGPLVTTHTQKVMMGSFADYAVIGEGEKTVVELVDAIRYKKDVKYIKGIAYKTFDELHINSPREPITDLDTISYPARHLLDMNRYTTHHFKSFGLKLPYNVKSTTAITLLGCFLRIAGCYQDVVVYDFLVIFPENSIC